MLSVFKQTSRACPTKPTDHFVTRKARQMAKNRAFRETSNFYLVKLNFNFILRPSPQKLTKIVPLLKSENLVNYCWSVQRSPLGARRGCPVDRSARRGSRKVP